MKLRRLNKRRFSLVILAVALALVGFGVMSPDTVTQITKGTPVAGILNDASDLFDQASQTVSEAQPGLARVVTVIDGDTMTVSVGGKTETVRFIGIDTPETHDPRKAVQCFGEAAAAHSHQLLDGASVRLEADPTNSNRDKYNRLLRYVYLPDGTLVNAAIIQDGYAFAYVVFPFERLDEFKALEQEARSNNRGLWAGCNVDESQKIKQTTDAK